MRRLLPWLLSGCAALLLLVIGAELVPASPEPLVPGLIHAARPHAPRAAAAPDRSEQWAATVLARPLFSPQRRPPPPAGVVAQAATALPRLTGILVGPDGARAIFAPDGGKPIVLGPGGRLDGGVIRAIGVGGVVLARAGGEQVLHPRFDAAVAAASEAPAAPNFLQQVLRGTPQGIVDPNLPPSDPNDLPGITPFARPNLPLQFQPPLGRPP